MADPEHVTRLEYEGRELILIGTAHVSRQSVIDVETVIERERPDTVCVELDELRFEALVNDHRWRNLDIFQIIRDKKVLFLLANLSLAAFQRRVGEKFGVRPGAEMLAAVNKAEAMGAKLVLADRNVQATLKRSWEGLRFFDKMRLIGLLVAQFFVTPDISEEDLEAIKDRDTIGEALKALADEMPGLQGPMIDERDRYLISSMREASGNKIVGVVGAAHVAGMIRHLRTAVDRDALCVIPKPSVLARSLKWVIPAIVLSAFYFGYTRHAGEDLQHMIYAWVLPNSIAAAILSAVAGAKLLTIVVAFIASPLTSLNPTIGAGMVAGLVEAWLRRPTVNDCEGIGDAILTLRGMYTNQFTRVLLVVIGATLGSALGAWIGAAWVVKLL